MDALQILGLQPGCTAEDAKKAYHKLVKQYHPDKNSKSEAKFLQVVQAYEVLCAFPELLTNVPQNTQNFLDYIIIALPVDMEDFYFGRKKQINYSRFIDCKQCSGTGSLYGINGICPTCSGQGNIDSDTLSLMGRSGTCPSCKGTGVKDQKFCTICEGRKRVLDICRITIIPHEDDSVTKVITLKGQGNQTGKATYSDVYVRLLMKDNPAVRIFDRHFVVYEKILPVQKIIGDQAKLTLFGREITYTIVPGSVDAYTVDILKDGTIRNIHIRYVDEFPAITEETKKLYKRILDIEKVSLRKKYEAQES